VADAEECLETQEHQEADHIDSIARKIRDVMNYLPRRWTIAYVTVLPLHGNEGLIRGRKVEMVWIDPHDAGL
jgi:hypothetical protein